jgi:hypothetical protein
MQNLMSSMFQVKTNQPTGPNVTAAFANAGLLGHMFGNTTMQATAQMEGAMQHIRNTTLTSKLGSAEARFECRFQIFHSFRV